MATYSKLPSGTWRAQPRREGRYISQTFLKRDEGRAEGLADFKPQGRQVCIRPSSIWRRLWAALATEGSCVTQMMARSLAVANR